MIEPVFPFVTSVVVAAIVLAVLIVLETRRKQRFLVFRIVAQIFLVGSVLLLILRPSIVTSRSENILLLTNGYDQKTIDSLPSLKPVAVASVNELSKLNGVSVIAGDGLPSWALDLLPSRDFKFVPSAEPNGITWIDLDDHIYAHRWNEIRGTYNGEETTIKLRGPGGIDDSVKVSKGNFSLSFFAKAPGRFNYELITEEGIETLPLVIEPERALNIIFISNYPTFEVRYLKNFLASKGHRLSIRNQVSKGLYKFEFANRPAINFQSLTTALLNDTDLLIIDENSLTSSSPSDQKNLRTAVDNGLGVIVLPETAKAPLIEFTQIEQQDTATISLGRAGSIQLPALSIESKKSTPLLTAKGRVVNGYSYSGAGKVGYQLLKETYRAGLQGKSDIYSALWVPLLEKVARTAKKDFKLKITSPFPYYENEPISFDIISSGKDPKITIDNIQYPLTEDVFIDDLWHGTTWLDGNQWHEFLIDSVTTAVHVAKSDTWRSVSASNNRKATALRAGEQSNETTSLSKDDSTIKILLFVTFILAAGFLWLAPKL